MSQYNMNHTYNVIWLTGESKNLLYSFHRDSNQLKWKQSFSVFSVTSCLGLILKTFGSELKL